MSLRSADIDNSSGPCLGKFLDFRRAAGTMILDAKCEHGEPRQICLEFCRPHNARGSDVESGNPPQELFGGDSVLEIDRVSIDSRVVWFPCMLSGAK